MTRIGILSDTHGFLHEKIFDFFREVSEIWHAGDIGNIEVVNKIQAFKPLKAVYGNIDDSEIRKIFPKYNVFGIESKKILLTHIGGNPNKYDVQTKEFIMKEHPDIVVCGHSHICRVEYDKKNNLLYINPGAAGKFGIHQKITLLRLTIDNADIKDLEILELKK